jgi:hypothetical protein
VHQKIEGALAAHRLAAKRLSTGKGNALSIGEHICSLGVQIKRPMPPMVFEELAITTVEAAQGEGAQTN